MHIKSKLCVFWRQKFYKIFVRYWFQTALSGIFRNCYIFENLCYKIQPDKKELFRRLQPLCPLFRKCSRWKKMIKKLFLGVFLFFLMYRTVRKFASPISRFSGKLLRISLWNDLNNSINFSSVSILYADKIKYIVSAFPTSKLLNPYSDKLNVFST